MTYDPNMPRSSTNHPETLICSVCGETIAWDDASSHYLLSGIYGCVNKPMPREEQIAWMDAFYRKSGLKKHKDISN